MIRTEWGLKIMLDRVEYNPVRGSVYWKIVFPSLLAAVQDGANTKHWYLIKPFIRQTGFLPLLRSILEPGAKTVSYVNPKTRSRIRSPVSSNTSSGTNRDQLWNLEQELFLRFILEPWIRTRTKDKFSNQS